MQHPTDEQGLSQSIVYNVCNVCNEALDCRYDDNKQMSLLLLLLLLLRKPFGSPPLPSCTPLSQCAAGSVNQIPRHATVSGDCRVTPFYSTTEVMESIEAYVAEINADLSLLPTRGSFSKYILPNEGRRGSLELTWLGAGADGIACDLSSKGAKALNSATVAVLGKSTPYSISGSLPLVRWLQDQGYDIQICGYGLSSRYHAENEYCSLSAMSQAVKILAKVVAVLED